MSIGNHYPVTNPDHELVLAISRAVDSVRDGITDQAVVWVPLEALLPFDECHGFMFMGAHVGACWPDGLAVDSQARKNGPYGYITDAIDCYGKPWVRRTIFEYKNGITRKYLHIGEDLRCYAYHGNLRTADDVATYQPFRTERMIDLAFDGIEELGATRTTAYDDEFRAARNARLAEAGYTVIN